MMPALPGDILKQLIEAGGWTQASLARAMDVDTKSVNRIVNGRCTVTAHMALKLEGCFEHTAMFWLVLQSAVDLYDARQRAKHASKNP